MAENVLKEAPPHSLPRRAAASAAEFAHKMREVFESAPPALRPAAFVPWFLLNLGQVPEALERIATHGGQRRFSSPLEVLQGAPTERTLAGDLAQVAFGAQGVQPTAQLARGAVRLPIHALDRAVAGPLGHAAEVGAVKLPGGEWNPRVVDRVARYLTEGTSTDPEVARRIARNYLNKHLGTEKDPAKDLRVPADWDQNRWAPEGHTRRWEDITDEVISSVPRWLRIQTQDKNLSQAPLYEVGYSKQGAPYLDTPVGPTQYNRSEADFYRNVREAGQYLGRVPPEKRGQYDFPRIMKEAAQERAKAAQEADRLRLLAQEGLTPHREYVDGYKWVEIAPPARLTPEQYRSVREIPGDPDADRPRRFEALDSRRQPIHNSYTDAPAVGSTPEEAWLAGKLAQEGNEMGHCVGGYCPGIMRKESRVFSLRDPKGKSHVTIEATPGEKEDVMTAVQWYNQNLLRTGGAEARWKFYEEYRVMSRDQRTALATQIGGSPEYRAYFDEVTKRNLERPWKISQIQGKANAPVKGEYERYVDDFLRAGPWENTSIRGWRGDD